MVNLFNRTTFDFVGTLKTGKELVTDQKMGSSDWMKKRANFGVAVGTNVQFLTLEYIHNPKIKQDKVKLYGKDGEQFEVATSQTTNPEVIAKVNDMFRTVIDLEQDFDNKKEYMSLIFKRRTHEMKEEQTEDDVAKIKEYTAQIEELATNRVEFVTTQDAVNYIGTVLEDMKGKKVRVTGSVKVNYYNGKSQLQYVPSRIEFVNEEMEEKLEVHADVFFDKDCMDDDKENKKIIVSGYIGERIKKADKLFPTAIVIDYSKIDLENQQHVQLLEFMKSTFKIANKKTFTKMGVFLNVINGSQQVEFDESCLTENQKMGIAFGLNTLDDFKPRNKTIYGSRITELRLSKPDLKAYPEFGVEVFELDEISNFLQSDDSDKKLEDVKETPKQEAKAPEPSADDMLKSLFG